MTEQLWAAVDRLTKPTREKLERDGDRFEWMHMPSLFDQLAEAVQSGAGGMGHGKQQSRPPLDIACMSLLLEIADTVADACRSYSLKRTFDTPKDLRQVASQLLRVGDEDLTSWWTDQLRSWCGQIKAAISCDPDRSWRLHGLACPECGADSIPERTPDGTMRTPAIEVVWRAGLVRAVACRMCGATWMRGEGLDTLAERVLEGSKSSDMKGRMSA